MKARILAQLAETRSIYAAMEADELLLAELQKATEACQRSLKDGKKILLAGNGGSAADAQHGAGEYVSRFALSSYTPRIQEAHIDMSHIMCGLVEESYFGRTAH